MSSNLPINKQIEKYIDEHSFKLHPVQDEIIKHNDTLGKKKKLQISINQCHFLYLVTKLFKPKEILEIGTFTGLSSLSMCIGLENDSKITTIDKNKETSLVAKNFFENAKVSEQIDIIIDEAINGINKLINQKKLFDLIFIDADKENYKKYYDFIQPVFEGNEHFNKKLLYLACVLSHMDWGLGAFQKAELVFQETINTPVSYTHLTLPTKA